MEQCCVQRQDRSLQKMVWNIYDLTKQWRSSPVEKKINLFIFSLPGEIFNNIEPAGGKFSQIILLTLFEIFTYIKRITVQFT